MVLSSARISPAALAVQDKVTKITFSPYSLLVMFFLVFQVFFFGGSDASGNATSAIDVFYTTSGWASFVLRTQQLTCAREAPHAVLAGTTGAVDWGTLRSCPCFTVDTTSTVNSTSAALITDFDSTARSPIFGAASAAVAAQPFSFAAFGGGYSDVGVYSAKIQTMRLPGADPPLDFCINGPPSSSTSAPLTTASITMSPAVTTPLATLTTVPPTNNYTTPIPSFGKWQ
jgi:hypothetical protein